MSSLVGVVLEKAQAAAAAAARAQAAAAPHPQQTQSRSSSSSSGITLVAAGRSHALALTPAQTLYYVSGPRIGIHCMDNGRILRRV